MGGHMPIKHAGEKWESRLPNTSERLVSETDSMFVNSSAQPAVTFDPAEQLDHTLCFLAADVEQEGAMAASSSHEVKAPTEEVEKAASKNRSSTGATTGNFIAPQASLE